MKTLIYTGLLITLLIVGCSTIKVTNIKNIESYKEPALIFNLPNTLLEIDVELNKTVFKKGPYADYAAELLGISDFIKEDTDLWQINNIQINSLTEPDTNNYYLLKTKGANKLNLISLSKNGVLLAINQPNSKANADSKTNFLLNINEENINIKDLSTSETVFAKEDTTYKYVKIDSNFVKVPIIDKEIITRTIEEKAKEAAKIIFQLRKRKLEVLTGDSEETPKESYLNTLIKEMNLMEEEYLTLFVGKKSTLKYHSKFYYTPNPQKDPIPVALFNFSNTTGISNSSSTSGDPIYIKVESSKNLLTINNLINKQIKPFTKGVPYRIPDQATITIFNSQQNIANIQLPINQFGIVNYLPCSLLKKGNVIEFYQEQGTLKRISE